MATTHRQLHFFLLPFPAPSHTAAMLHMAVLFARHGARSTVVTTPSGATRILSAGIVDPSADPLVDVAVLSPPEEYHALSGGLHDVAELSTPHVPEPFAAALETLRGPFELLLRSRRPDCVVSDFYMYWSVDSASLLGIPRLAFGGVGMFILHAARSLARHLASSHTAKEKEEEEEEEEEEESVVLPGLPHRIEMKRSYICSFISDPPSCMAKIAAANNKSQGMVVNSFHQLEPEYAFDPNGNPCWLIGPLFAHSTPSRACRDENIWAWLESKRDRSVVYVCFGTLGRFTRAQTREIAVALRSLGRPFIWVMREEQQEWLPERFEEEVALEGMVVPRWAPQRMILNHRAVGAFVSHCGWNSTMEAVSAGVPVVAWPLFADQPFNAAEVVQVLGTGVAVEGVRCSTREEERGLVHGEAIARAVERAMDDEAVRRRAREMKEKARRAVEEGGSSCLELHKLFKQISERKWEVVERSDA